MALAVAGTSFQPAAAANTVNVVAGAESSDGSAQVNLFAPNNIHVNVGDTVTWIQKSTEFHTVTFLSGAPVPDFVQVGPDGPFFAPEAATPPPVKTYDGTGLASSGLLSKGGTWNLTFTKAGTYNFVCIVHPFMTGTVTVGAPGQAVDAQQAIDNAVTTQVNALLAGTAEPLVYSKSAELLVNDSTQPGVTTGTSDQSGQVFIPRFLPSTVVVHTGDTLTWVWGDPETPHTVTFLAGQAPPDLVVPQPQDQGPPKILLNPDVLRPSGDPTAYGGGYLSSGFINPAIPGAGTASYSVTFAQPGTYGYVCLLHEGMTGTVVVQ